MSYDGIIDPRDETIERLQAQVDHLQFCLDEIRGVNVMAPWNVYLTASEIAVVNTLALASPRILTRESILTAIHPTFEQPHFKIVDVFLHRARKALEPVGIEIETVYGQGRMMRKESAQRWLAWTGMASRGEEPPADYPKFEAQKRLRRKAA